MPVSMGKAGVPKEWYKELASGNLFGWSIIHKFGKASVGTSFVPICIGGIYRTPQVAGATPLRVKAGNAADAAGQAGARKIYIEGLDATGAMVSEELTTAGESASSNSSNSYIRLYRAYVSESGTYATSSAGSHTADVVIENSAGTEDWLTISTDSSTFPRGQSEVGAYTVPLGKEAYIKSMVVSVDSTKSANLLFFQRQNILETAAPYSAMRIVLELGGVSGEEIVQPATPFGPFPALTDLGFMGKVASGSAEVDVDFEIILRDV